MTETEAQGLDQYLRSYLESVDYILREIDTFRRCFRTDGGLDTPVGHYRRFEALVDDDSCPYQRYETITLPADRPLFEAVAELANRLAKERRG